LISAPSFLRVYISRIQSFQEKIEQLLDIPKQTHAYLRYFLVKNKSRAWLASVTLNATNADSVTCISASGLKKAGRYTFKIAHAFFGRAVSFFFLFLNDTQAGLLKNEVETYHWPLCSILLTCQLYFLYSHL
jgi:hypothetical protein